jgi:type IV secretory pathway VirB4 component
VVDEAHVFIDEQRPIALDFMFNMAKRIRKYDGMQIIITQNIKDFVGSPVIAKKSAAIINASQYSMIFSLAPNDMTDLVTLYKNAGEINKTEQNQIVGNARGQCFFISGPMNRTLITIETSDEIRKLFE